MAMMGGRNCPVLPNDVVESMFAEADEASSVC